MQFSCIRPSIYPSQLITQVINIMKVSNIQILILKIILKLNLWHEQRRKLMPI